MRCQPVLRELASRDWLTVRALARRLVEGDEPPLVPSATPEPALLADDDEDLDTQRAEETIGRKRRPRRLLEAWWAVVCDEASAYCPGCTKAVQRRGVRGRRRNRQKRLNSQLDDLASRVRKRWPDAFLVHEETIEGTLQSVAAGGRAAMLGTGKLITNAVEWEDKLASALVDDPKLPLILEATRQPRPPIPAPPGNGHAIWDRVRDRAAGVENLLISMRRRKKAFSLPR